VLAILWLFKPQQRLYYDVCSPSPPSAGGSVICDTTPRSQGRNFGALFKLAQELEPRGVHIILGTGWSSAHDGERSMSVSDLKQELLRDLVIGARLSDSSSSSREEAPSSSSTRGSTLASAIGRCGLIGEIALECKGGKISTIEQQVLACCAGVHADTGAPILIAMAPTTDASLNAANQVAQMLTGEHKVVPSKLCMAGCFAVGCGSRERASLYSNLHSALVSLLQLGIRLCVDVGDAGLPVPVVSTGGQALSSSGDDEANKVDFVTIDEEEVAALVSQLCTEGWSGQLMLGNNTRFKHQLEAFGGQGYGSAIVGFTSRLERQGVEPTNLELLLHRNAYDWLAWYTPPKPKARPARPPWKCDGPCGKEYKAKKEPFTRLDFRYCSVKCMRAHQEELDAAEGTSGDGGGGGGGGRKGRAGNSSAWGISVGSG
jgi:predicted metal-dependent phosphotriesterase family hydrolase